MPCAWVYGLLFVLTVICMGFKALLSESLFECCARGFYDLLLFIDVICMVLRRFLEIAGLHVGFIGSW